MKLLVTGGAGFLGRECLRQLAREGHDVATTDRRGTVDWRGDLADPSFSRQLPAVDTLVHCAAVQYLSPDLPWFSRSGYFQRNNVTATRNLVDRYGGSGTHFVFVGSSMMYEQNRAPVYQPASPMRAQGAYSASKLAAFAHVERIPDPKTLLVPCIIAGPGRGGLFVPFARSILRLGIVVFPGTGEHPIHIVHVEDAAALICTVVAKRAQGTFNAASPGPLSIRDWAREIAQEFHVPRVRHVRLPLTPIQTLSRLLGYRLLAQEQLLMLEQPHVLATDEGRALGWEPAWTNARIVRATVRAFHQNGPSASA